MKHRFGQSTAVLLILLIPLAASPFASLTNLLPPFLLDRWMTLRGTASWYSESDRGINERTASGERFDDSKKTCASWDYPFGTYLQVTNQDNGRTVICRVNDRGPSPQLDRALDLTKSAFEKISDTGTGLIEVSVKPLAFDPSQGS